MLKDEILKMVEEIKEAPGVRNVMTFEYPDGRWVPMILVIQKDGNFGILKKQNLAAEQEKEAIQAIEEFIMEIGSGVENMRYHQTH
jgi:hypothetical protein